MITEQDRLKAGQLVTQAAYAARSGDPTQARRLAQSAARLDPSSEQPWLLLASLAAPKARIVYLEKALACNPTSLAAMHGLQKEQERLGHSAEIPTQTVRVHTPKLWPFAFPFQAWIKHAEKAREQRIPDQDMHPSALSRIARYTLVRAVVLAFTLVASLALIIYIVNLGGYLDTITEGAITENLIALSQNAATRRVPPDQIQEMVEQARWGLEEAYGLHEPFLIRCAGWLYRGLTLNWGNSRFYYQTGSSYGHEFVSNDILEVFLDYLPRTLLLLGISNFGIFLISIFLAIPLARSPGSWLNRLIMALAPTSAAPGWVYGLILYALSYSVLGIYNLRLGYNNWPTKITLDILPIVLRGLALPFLAIFFSKFFQSVYAWRTYFLVYTREDYVELARAKGLPDRLLERRYLIRPALPGIITSFALILISLWQECIAVEYFFKIQGIGGLFAMALQTGDVAVIVALTSFFAYFLALTVFFLEIVYVLTDPRVKIENENVSRSPHQLSGRRFSLAGLYRSVQAIRLPRESNPQKNQSHWEDTKPVRITIKPRLEQQASRAVVNGLARCINACRGAARMISHSPMAVSGATIVIILTGVSIYTVITIPYGTAIRQWRGDDKVWNKNPIEVPPQWINLFRSEKLPESIQVNSQRPGANKTTSTSPKGTRAITITLPFDYPYGTAPQDVMVQFTPRFKTMKPFVQVTWVTPDGRETPLSNFAVTTDTSYYPTRDEAVPRKLKGATPVEALFSNASGKQITKGQYTLRISGYLFEPESSLDAELVVIGKVYGWAGTDLRRRDLSLILLWGTVIALSFGILASIGTTLFSVFLAAASAWFGGWIDGLIQRITEINMVLPVLPVSILIFYLYSKSFWVLLGVVISLNIFGNALKNYRSMFLQFISAPYIEAARAYGATNWRIIVHYLIPRIRTVFIPQFIILIPGYIFLEATLAFLGVSDPTLPTLGKLIVTTMQMDIFSHPPHLVMEPFGMLIFIGMGFALLGFALENVYNDQAGI